jgi:hypothetical protein
VELRVQQTERGPRLKPRVLGFAAA